MSKIVSPAGSLVVSSGTLQTALDGTLNGSEIFVAGSGATAGLNFIGDAAIGFANPTIDYLSMIANLVPGQATAGAAVINAVGIVVNEGTIASNGPAGSVLTVNILPTSTSSPGYFFNPGLMIANLGDSLIINVGSNAALYNTGSIVANGGFVQINFAPGAVFGGDAPTRGFNIIEAGGTLETGSFVPSYVGSNGTHGEYEFGDSTSGNTLKIDNLAAFGGVILHFAAGDTIDIGTSLQVGTLAYDVLTGFLLLEATNGTTLATLNIGNDGTGIASGTFAVTNGSADGFTLGTGADGNTVLTTNMGLVKSSGASGAWQSASVWAGGVPGTSSVADIGMGAASPFTLTTSGAPVSVGGISIDSAAPTLTIASNVTLTAGGNDGQIGLFGGTVSVASGNTIVGGAIQLYAPGSNFTLAAGATAHLAGRLNINVGPTAGVWPLQLGGNPHAFSVGAGYAEIDGALIAGPTASTRGGSVSIGYNSGGQSAVMVVNAGGTVTATHTTMGSDPTSSGTLIVNGIGASYTDMIDPADTAFSRGNITIGFNDIGSNIAVGLTQPGPIAPAQLIIENGATMTEQGSGASIGNSFDSVGAVTVVAGGFWNLAYNGVSGGLGVGRQGSGSLSILSSGSVAIGATETILSNGTTTTSGGMGVGQVAGGTGTVLVSGTGSQLSTLNGFSVGGGGQGLFSILNGGTVLVKAGSVSVGTTAGATSSGTIVVGGSGSAAALTYAAGTGGLTVGSASRGTLIVGDGGSVNLNTSGFLTVGSATGSSGTIVVGGTTAAAVINIGTAGLTVGNSGAGVVTANSLGTIAVTGTLGTSIMVGQNSGASGTLTVNGGLVTEGTSSTGMTVGLNSGASGGAVVQSGGSLVLGGGGLVLGANAGAAGTVSVNGAGSALRVVTAGINAGSSGAGTVSIANGGSAGVGGGVNIGINGGGGGNITVSGAGSRLNVTGGVATGLSGTGLLTIANGGSLGVGGALTIGQNSGGSGTVALSGTGNTLTVAGGIEVGVSGTGTLTMQGGTATAAFLALGGSAAGPLGTGSNRGLLTGGADLTDSGNLAVWAGSTLSLDATSAIDVGVSGAFIGGAVNLESGHTLIGAGIIAAAVINNGLIQSSGASVANGFPVGTLDIQGAISGAGSIIIGSNSVLRLDSSLAAGEPIQFGTDAELILNAPGTRFANAITGLAMGDRIELNLPGASITNVQNSAGTVTVFTNLGSYVLANVGFAVGAGSSFYWGTDFSTGFAQIQIAPANLNWTGATSTAFGTAANWQPNQTPNATMVANFVNNPGTVTGVGSALELQFGTFGTPNAGTWTLNNTTLNATGFPNPPFLPASLGFYANTVLNGGTLNGSSGTSWIGNVGGESVTAQSGANVTTLGDNIGTNAGQSGSLTLTGVGTSWTETTNGSFNGNGTGWINLGQSGPGNGQAGSAGFLTVTNSATLNTGGFAALANSTGSYGSATVSAGGSWTIGSGLTAGGGGTGVVSVSGGTIGVKASAIFGQNTAGYGSLSINTGLFTTGSQLTLGQFAGSTGNATLTNGTIIATGGFQDGSSGAGTISVGSGGTLQFGGSFNPVGANAGGTGLLSITAGGTVAETTTFGTTQVLQIGAASGAAGTVIVSGAGSLLNLNGNGFNVGNSGAGTLNVLQGGTVSASVANSNLGQALSAANNAGGNASITVSGTGSVMNLGGFVAMGQLGTANMTVTSGGAVNIANAATNATGFSIGAGFSTTTNSGGIANVTVNNSGTLTDQGGMTIGGDGATGVLNVASGGIVQVGTQLTVGIATLNNGVLYGGTGSLNIGAGGTVAITMAPQTTTVAVVFGNINSSAGLSTGNAAGDATVSGAGALLTTNGNALEVGRSSIGNLTISQGGSVVTGTPNSSQIAALLVGRFSTGSVLLTDSGSSLTATGFSAVGRAGSGSLTIQNHATMTVLNDASGQGAIAVGSGQGSPTSSPVVTSVITGGVGQAQVTSGGDLYSQSNVIVGRFGATGLLNVNTGGTVEANARVMIGQTETLSTGGSLISSLGTTIVNATSLLAGTGTVNVGQGGRLQADGSGITLAGTAAIAIGVGDNSVAALNVTGAGASVSSQGFGIAVGAAGAGALTIAQGGTVLAGTPFANDEAIYAGNTNGATGAITVTDAGSRLQATGQMSVGMAGTGSLLIQNQGSVFSGGNTADVSQGFELGQFATGAGQATVTGPQSLLSNTGRFIVGDAGYGNLAILNDGTVVTNGGLGATIGAQSGASGLIDVEGNGSRLQVGGTIQIGSAGTGELIIGKGATVTAGGFSVGAGGTVLQTGGGIGGSGASKNTGVVGGIGSLNGGVENDGTIYAQGGTYTVSGSITTGAGLAGNLLVNGGGADLVLNGSVSGGQTVAFVGSGGTLTIGNLGGFTPTQITGFTAGDTIVIVGSTLTAENFNAATDRLVLTDTMGNHDTLQFTGSLTASILSAGIVAATSGGSIGVTESGLAYTWDTHALLSGVAVAATGSGDPSGAQALPMELRGVQVNNGTITAQLWGNAGSGAGNFDAAFGFATGVTGSFSTAPTLPAGWSVLSNPGSGTLTVGGISLTNLTGWSQLGSVSFVLPGGTTQTQISLTSGDIGSVNATPLSVSWSSATSGSNGGFAISALTPDTYSLTASRSVSDLGSAITSADALAALKMAVGIDPNPTINGVQGPVSPYQFIAADINGDGKINSADALNILKMAVGLPSAPAASWVFLPETQTFWNAATQNYTVTQSSVPTNLAIASTILASGSVDLVGVLKGDVNASWAAPSGSSTLPLSYFVGLSRSTGAPLATWGIETLTVAQALAAHSANAGMPVAAIADTAANVAGSIDGLQGIIGSIAGIVLTDAGTPVLAISQTQDSNDTGVLNAILTPYTLSVPAIPVNSTWSWNGAGWTLLSGPGNAGGKPNNGDTAIVKGGTVAPSVDANLIGNLVALGGTAGASGVLTMTGDTGTNYNNPTFDNGTTLTNAVPGLSTAESSVLNANGITVNQGTILANGAAGSVFTINIGTAAPGTVTIPGYFYNPGEIDADAGNTVIVNIGTASELFNTGQIQANGGTVVINVASGAISGGEAPVRGVALIQAGGTLITALSYPSSDGNNGTRSFDIFVDSASGNTLKIENLGSFGDSIQGFAAGDTIDLGSSLAVGTLAYSSATGFLQLENAAGATLATLGLTNWSGQIQSGTFAVAGGSADGINISLGADGDTILTTAATESLSNNVSGTWQTGSIWAGGTIPSSTAAPLIGINSNTPFTITTGTTAVTAGGFELISKSAEVQITSNTTLSNQIHDFGGSIDVTAGSTLSVGAVQMTFEHAALTVETGAVLSIAGRLNPSLAPINGVWTAQAGGNVYGMSVFSGTLTVAGSMLAGPSGSNRGGSTSIGYESSGTPATMLVNSGTVVTTHTTMGSDATSSGTLIVSGAGASYTDVIDPGDTASSRGNIVVGYNDVSLNTPAGLLPPAAIAPAQLTIQNGATMTEQQGATVGGSANSSGIVTVQSGGFWNLANNGIGFLGVGNGGIGTVSVLNGGSVAVGNNGTFLSNGTTQISGGIGLGQNAGNTGTLVVSGAGSQLSTLNGMAVGKSGQGLLSIVNGGTVLVTGGGIGVGTTGNAASSGTIAVGGSGAAAMLNFSTLAGGLTIGSASKGTLTVADAGSIVMNGTGYLTVGSAAGAFGTVTVAGTSAAASLSIATAGLTIGNTGTASVTVGSFGTIALHGTNAVTIGQNSGAAGTLTVQNGGILTDTGGLTIGQAAGALGTVTVSGAGSGLTVQGSAAVGVSGTASVTVQTGGVANFNGGLFIGSAGSLLDSGGTVAVSGSIQPSATIGLQSGGVLNLAAATNTFAVTIQSGVDTASVSAGLGSPSLAFIGTPDAVTLGTGPAVVNFALQPTSGLETIANFVFGTDQLNIDLVGAASGVLTTANTTVNSVAAISVYSSADPTHGVILMSPGGGVTAATLLSGHTTFSSGHALIS